MVKEARVFKRKLVDYGNSSFVNVPKPLMKLGFDKFTFRVRVDKKKKIVEVIFGGK